MTSNNSKIVEIILQNMMLNILVSIEKSYEPYLILQCITVVLFNTDVLQKVLLISKTYLKFTKHSFGETFAITEILQGQK